MWPVPVLDGHRPVISDGFGSVRGTSTHVGVDLMFMRAATRELVETYRPGTPNGTRRYYMPDTALVVAASAGRVWSAGATSRGYLVMIDHGAYATLYQHLASLFVAEQKAGRDGFAVEAGQPLGIVGGDPLDPGSIKHLHFELWRGANPIDPEPMMARWELLEVGDAPSYPAHLRGPAVTTRAPALLRPPVAAVRVPVVDRG